MILGSTMVVIMSGTFWDTTLKVNCCFVEM
jgi:hypothetical protein